LALLPSGFFLTVSWQFLENLGIFVAITFKKSWHVLFPSGSSTLAPPSTGAFVPILPDGRANEKFVTVVSRTSVCFAEALLPEFIDNP
jgi:hypothetical protein